MKHKANVANVIKVNRDGERCSAFFPPFVSLSPSPSPSLPLSLPLSRFFFSFFLFFSFFFFIIIGRN